MPGLRDRNLLESALAPPRQHYDYAECRDTITLAALYAADIVRNHPFVDGNKRVGFVLGVLFLELNGYRFTASEEHATQAVLDLAVGVINETAYAAWLIGNCRKR